MNTIIDRVGNTPLVSMNPEGLEQISLRAKLEYYNPTGSIKDRSADYLLRKLTQMNQLNSQSIVIESTSGNFGVSLSTYCRYYEIPFYCVIDPLISPVNDMLIRSQGANIIKVTERDENGGYLLNRIRKIKEFIEGKQNVYWVNQYENTLNAEAYYHSLGSELCNENNKIDYLFIGVSSGGTISGLSKKIKEVYPNCIIIAVDVRGSIVFGGEPKKRFIPGIGSSLVPPILKQAIIDDVVIVDEGSSILECRRLLSEHAIFSGGSSGAILSAMRKYFDSKVFSVLPQVVAIFADRGDRYASTIYNDDWVLENFPKYKLDGK